jgi:hypothetical protein
MHTYLPIVSYTNIATARYLLFVSASVKRSLLLILARLFTKLNPSLTLTRPRRCAISKPLNILLLTRSAWARTHSTTAMMCPSHPPAARERVAADRALPLLIVEPRRSGFYTDVSWTRLAWLSYCLSVYLSICSEVRDV